MEDGSGSKAGKGKSTSRTRSGFSAATLLLRRALSCRSSRRIPQHQHQQHHYHCSPVRQHQPVRPRFLFLCADQDHKGLVRLRQLAAELSKSGYLPAGCILDCRTLENAAVGRYDAVFVVAFEKEDDDSEEGGDANRSLPAELVRLLSCENWRYHLVLPFSAIKESASTSKSALSSLSLTTPPSAAWLAAKGGLAHWCFSDRLHLHTQLSDLMYEKARDMQHIPLCYCQRKALS